MSSLLTNKSATSFALVFVSGLAAGLALSSSVLGTLVSEDIFSAALIASRRLASSSPNVIWGLGGALIMLWMFRRHNRSAIKNLDREVSLAANGARMQPLAQQIPTAAPIEIPRSLIQNPFSDGIDGVDFETRVQWAIAGSLRHGRVLGVIHFEFLTSTVSVGASNSGLLDIRMIAVQKELKAHLRSGDCLRITGEGKISVIVTLLSVRSDLERIAEQLYVVALKAGAELELPLAYLPGCAMYPIDGYSFAELRQAAEDRAARVGVKVTPIADRRHIDAHARKTSKTLQVVNRPGFAGGSNS
jgi:hypothetical protein